uniref:Uncharacterized protein n=1 Tax=Arundo donax TaxID=35708 RepID=A0A0A9EBF7_ARUDO
MPPPLRRKAPPGISRPVLRPPISQRPPRAEMMVLRPAS